MRARIDTLFRAALFARARFGRRWEVEYSNGERDVAPTERSPFVDNEGSPRSASGSRCRVSTDALFIRRETSRRASTLARARLLEEISDSLPMGRGWMRTRDAWGGSEEERQCAPGGTAHGTAVRNFTRRRPTGRQTRAMDEMLTRRETIDYSRQDRSRQVEREMVFLYRARAATRALTVDTRDAFIPGIKMRAGKGDEGRVRTQSSLCRASMKRSTPNFASN